jgi:hypothetical protein
LIVVELDDVVPRRRPKKPNLYVAKTLSSPEIRFEQLLRAKKTKWFHGHLRRLRTELSMTLRTSDPNEAQKRLKELVRRLALEGYTVNQSNATWTVYVVELAETASKGHGKGHVYVGQTSLTPEERFEKHMSKARNSKGRLYSNHVANHGRRLRMNLAPKTFYLDQATAKKAEAEWGDHLRNLGYDVKGAH